jgi:16S rRNA C967 or C1407 C5-methylase (RsmB/RsmF family)
MLPKDVLDRLHALSGDDRDVIEQAFEQPSPTAVRYNPLKGVGVNGFPVPWCGSAVYLAQRPSFVADPLFHLGAYYVQETASMFLEQFVRQTGMDKKPVLALDLCAAPGGKSTHLRSLLHPDSLLICNEVMPDRRNVLQENIWKWGYRNVCVSQAQAASFVRTGEEFDLIMLDAPCSGAGMMRKDPYAIEQWSSDLVLQCAQTQRELLHASWQLLRPGGLLIYSTCTFVAEENENQVRYMLNSLDAELVHLNIEEEWNLVQVQEGLYFMPNRTWSEGLFMTAMRKPGVLDLDHSGPKTQDPSDQRVTFCEPAGHYFQERNELITAVDGRWKECVQRFGDELSYFIPGIPVSMKKGKEWVPHPALALNELLVDEVTRVEVDTAESIALLRGEVLRRDVQKGLAVATYQGLPFVWLKGAGNRWNQSWPSAWRIRSHDLG